MAMANDSRVTTVSLREMKDAGQKISVLTAYDYPTAHLMDEAGVDILLVGDSCGNAVMGLPDTLGVTMDDMLRHVKMVSRAASRAMVVADMPFMSYQVNPERALENAARFVAEAGAHAIKLEGGADRYGEAIEAIVRAGIPVMGHVGLLPQSVNQIGGYRVQGRTPESRQRIHADARGLEELGCFSVVIECVPPDLAAEITADLGVPTIGIGAGAGCDGQVLVMHDMLGWGEGRRFCKTFGDIRSAMKTAFEQYVEEVKAGTFPAREHEYK